MVASVGLVVGGALWGLYWVPLRFMAERGLPGAWAGLMLYVGCAIVLATLVMTGRFPIRQWGFDLALCGLATGAAFSLFSTSLMFTDVVRSILLFYLTPIWGTLLGWVFLGEVVTRTRMIALALAVAGLLVVLGLGDGWPVPRNMGDWMALVAGMCWAFGTLRVYQMTDVSTFEQVTAFVFGALVVTVASMLLAPGIFAAGAQAELVMRSVPLAVVMVLYVLPMLVLTVGPARLLTPGRVGILLMSEVLVGVGSAAIWSGEPFGWREALGSALIIGAAVVEVAGPRVQTRAVS